MLQLDISCKDVSRGAQAAADCPFFYVLVRPRSLVPFQMDDLRNLHSLQLSVILQMIHSPVCDHVTDAAVCFQVYDFGEIIPAWSSEEAPHFNRQVCFAGKRPDSVGDLRQSALFGLIRVRGKIIDGKAGSVFNAFGFKVQFISKSLNQCGESIQLLDDLFPFPLLRAGKIMQADNLNPGIAPAFGQDAVKRYGIKSGEFKTETNMMGQKVTATTYFDQYGAVQLTKTKMSMMGVDLDMGTLMKDGKTYMINYGDKQVQEMPAQETINYMNLNDEAVKKYKVKSEGAEEVGGKSCLVFTMEVSERGQTAKARASVWEGIPMKTVTEVMGMSVTATVVELKEGPVDASLFELPQF